MPHGLRIDNWGFCNSFMKYPIRGTVFKFKGACIKKSVKLIQTIFNQRHPANQIVVHRLNLLVKCRQLQVHPSKIHQGYKFPLAYTRHIVL